MKLFLSRMSRRVWSGCDQAASGGRGRWLRWACGLVAVLGLAGQAEAALGSGGAVVLSWNQNPEPYLAGYRVMYGEKSGVYTDSVDVGNVTEFTLTDLVAGRVYYSVLIAYGSEGQQSPPSEEISFTPVVPQIPFAVEPLPAPAADDPALKASAPTITDWQPLETGGFGFTITAAPGTSLAVYGSEDMLNWVLLGTISNTTGRLRASDHTASLLPGRYYQVHPAP